MPGRRVLDLHYRIAEAQYKNSEIRVRSSEATSGSPLTAALAFDLPIRPEGAGAAPFRRAP